MARFSFHEGSSGRKRRNSSEKEEDLKKKKLGASKAQSSESDSLTSSESDSLPNFESDSLSSSELEEEDEQESQEVEGEKADQSYVEKRGEEAFRELNKEGEFNFRIDSDVLDCSICFEPLCPPIFQCKNGHIACSSCCPKLLNKCHVCAQPIGRQRCLPVEKIIEAIKTPCRYALHGCRSILSFTQRASHEDTCSHAALFCPVDNCTFCGSKSFLAAHVNRLHHNILKNFTYGEFFVVALERKQPFRVLLGEDGFLFLLLNNFTYFGGNALSVICLASNTPEFDFSYILHTMVCGGESSLRLRASPERVKKWSGIHPRKAFLVVPESFDGGSAEMYVTVCIKKLSAAGDGSRKDG